MAQGTKRDRPPGRSGMVHFELFWSVGRLHHASKTFAQVKDAGNYGEDSTSEVVAIPVLFPQAAGVSNLELPAGLESRYSVDLRGSLFKPRSGKDER